ncbi:hypothetical protein M0651_05790 [Paenibacillus sp. MBLB2552]|uniref:Uncharacterized protein n=1 Tax=Paenibacillus mellifer TaxID=2937794 RepID=A0A9X1XWN0_9BACL|nr:hypothetical protein [Paenibacillus mellifer]MCK8486684.1 hypothetical protein [Paenibacillus mellifer]
MEKLIINNDIFSEMLSSNDIETFISISEVLDNMSYKLIFSAANIETVFDNVIKVEDRDNRAIINKRLEKQSLYICEEEYIGYVTHLENLKNEEIYTIHEVLIENKYFDNLNFMLSFNWKDNNHIRNITSYDSLLDILILFTSRHDDIVSFTNSLNFIPFFVIDYELDKSLKNLNDGFDQRKNEILYHLYCIAKEIPNIIDRGFKDYESIGEQLTLSCSPERNRDTVKEKLIKKIDEKTINCELHTKMRRISSNAPDRIYFCPSVPFGVHKDWDNKIYIYQITAHV